LVLLDIRIRYDADGGGGTIFRGREASSGHRERFELLGRSRRGSLSESRRESNAVPVTRPLSFFFFCEEVFPHRPILGDCE
jgi:hypothetical protein